MCPFDNTAFAVSRKMGNYNSWMIVVTSTDNPKSVHNRCVIEVLVAFLYCHFVFECSVGIRVFVTGLHQISFYFF